MISVTLTHCRKPHENICNIKKVKGGGMQVIFQPPPVYKDCSVNHIHERISALGGRRVRPILDTSTELAVISIWTN